MTEKLEKSSGGLPQSAQAEEDLVKTSDPRAHYVELDALRGIAILGVVTCHIAWYWRETTQSLVYTPVLGVDLLDLLLFGYLGVSLFFLLSGYLLTWTEEGRKRRGIYSVRNYAKRRALRIVPAYYVAIAVVMLVWPILVEKWPGPSFGSVALHMAFLQGFEPSYPLGLDPIWWSLTPEIAFYAVLPLLVLKFRKFSQRVAILSLLLLVSLTTRLLQAYDVFGFPSSLDTVIGINRLYFFPTTTLYLFLVGMVLRMMVERRAGREPGYRHPYAASALTVASIGLLLAFPYLVMQQQEVLHHPVATLAEATVILMFASVLLGSPILKPILRFRPLAFLGEISYSLFLLHTTILIAMVAFIGPTLRAWVADQGELGVWATFVTFAFVALAVSGALSYLSYRYIESPFLRHKPK